MEGLMLRRLPQQPQAGWLFRPIHRIIIISTQVVREVWPWRLPLWPPVAYTIIIAWLWVTITRPCRIIPHWPLRSSSSNHKGTNLRKDHNNPSVALLSLPPPTLTLGQYLTLYQGSFYRHHHQSFDDSVDSLRDLERKVVLSWFSYIILGSLLFFWICVSHLQLVDSQVATPIYKTQAGDPRPPLLLHKKKERRGRDNPIVPSPGLSSALWRILPTPLFSFIICTRINFDALPPLHIMMIDLCSLLESTRCRSVSV